MIESAGSDGKNILKAESNCTVIITVYNTQAELLREAFLSAYQQTCVCDIVVVDDGSTRKETEDCLNELKEKYYDTPNMFFFRKQNEGPSAARYYGAQKAKTKYLLFLDADDLLTEDCVQQLTNLCYEHQLEYAEANKKNEIRNDTSEQLLESLVKDFSTFSWDLHGCIFERDIFLSACRPHFDIFRGEDMVMKAEYFTKCHRVGIIDTNIYLYRDNEESFMHVDGNNAKQLTITDAWVECWMIADKLKATDLKKLLGARIMENAIAAMGTCYRNAWYSTMAHYRAIVIEFWEYIGNIGYRDKIKAIIIRYFPWIYKRKGVL